jgi:hypothetical protein
MKEMFGERHVQLARISLLLGFLVLLCAPAGAAVVVPEDLAPPDAAWRGATGLKIETQDNDSRRAGGNADAFRIEGRTGHADLQWAGGRPAATHMPQRKWDVLEFYRPLAHTNDAEVGGAHLGGADFAGADPGRRDRDERRGFERSGAQRNDRNESGDDQRRYTTTGGTSVSAVPLPAGLPLLLSGLSALGLAARRRARNPDRDGANAL